jgi:hypothetical protein
MIVRLLFKRDAKPPSECGIGLGEAISNALAPFSPRESSEAKLCEREAKLISETSATILQIVRRSRQDFGLSLRVSGTGDLTIDVDLSRFQAKEYTTKSTVLILAKYIQ